MTAPSLPSRPAPDVTALLSRASEGDAAATDELLPLVYDELRRLAAHFMTGERPEHTLQPTALVHEAYLRLVGPPGNTAWRNRAHFFGAAAIAIRRILTDHARGRARDKRGGGRQRMELREDLPAAVGADPDLLELDAALSELATLDAQKAKLVELRFYAGLSVEEAARALGLSERSAARAWRFAQAWLHRRLVGGSSP